MTIITITTTTKQRITAHSLNSYIVCQEESNQGFTCQNNSRGEIFGKIFHDYLFRVITLFQRCTEVLTYLIKQKDVRKTQIHFPHFLLWSVFFSWILTPVEQAASSGFHRAEHAVWGVGRTKADHSNCSRAFSISKRPGRIQSRQITSSLDCCPFLNLFLQEGFN